LAGTAVIAIGGNAITRPDQKGTIPEQFANTRASAEHIADMIEEGYNVVITHGNGPQVGNILLRAELAEHILYPLPLDTCDADSQGGMGYMIQQVLDNVLNRRGLKKTVVTLVTQVVVDKNDPAFRKPTKPIGPFYEQSKAEKYKRERGWEIVEDAGRGYRRVVPSPMPLDIVEKDAIKSLVETGNIVIAVGGGGIPVVKTEDGSLVGVEAVVDKDLASSLLAKILHADLFMISTNVEKVSLNYMKPNQKDLDRMSLAEAKQYLAAGHFPPGNMGPKIRAAIEYLEAGGERVIITSIECLGRALRGETGTHITPHQS
jgi:carbamate kinase